MFVCNLFYSAELKSEKVKADHYKVNTFITKIKDTHKIKVCLVETFNIMVGNDLCMFFNHLCCCRFS